MATEEKLGLIKAAIADGMKTAPYELDGEIWFATNLEPLAAQLGFTSRTLKRLLKTPLLHSLTINPDGKKITLLRLGSELTTTQHQRLLLNLWRKELQRHNIALRDTLIAKAAELQAQIDYLTGKLEPGVTTSLKKAEIAADIALLSKLRNKATQRAAEAVVEIASNTKVSKKEYGCLRALVQSWKPGFAPTILKHTVRNWSEFTNAVKCHLYDLEASGAEIEERYFDFPSLTVIRRFWIVGLELWVDAELAAQTPHKFNSETAAAWLSIVELLKAKDAVALNGAALGPASWLGKAA